MLIETLHIEQQILKLAASMNGVIDRGDWPAVRRFFADDVALTIPAVNNGQPVLMTSDLFIAQMIRDNAGKIAFHSHSNAIVTVDGTNAKLATHLQAWSQYPDRPETLFEMWAFMDQEFVQSDGEWLVAAVGIYPLRERGGIAAG